MTHDDDARVADLLARLGDGDSKELFRRLLEAGMQELIDAELTAAIGAAPHERTESRANQRNGSRSRLLSTPASDVELRIPKVRVGSFFPSLLEPRRRVDKALWGVIMTAYTTGTSTRKVDDLVRALGCESGVSKSTVSRICAGIDEEVAVFRTRRLNHVAFPYVYLDATYTKARINHRIISRAVVVATGVTANEDREVLGVDVGDSEDEVFWTAFLRVPHLHRLHRAPLGRARRIARRAGRSRPPDDRRRRAAQRAQRPDGVGSAQDRRRTAIRVAPTQARRDAGQTARAPDGGPQWACLPHATRRAD